MSLGNPHLACVVDVPPGDIDLSVPPVVDHARFPDGANVEVVRVLGDGRLDMRVHERGSGETMSCGTGAVAAAVAATPEATRRSNGRPPGWRAVRSRRQLIVTLTPDDQPADRSRGDSRRG